MANVEAAEVNKFAELAHQWWDMQGVFKPRAVPALQESTFWMLAVVAAF